jgi:hypothetical protein
MISLAVFLMTCVYRHGGTSAALTMRVQVLHTLQDLPDDVCRIQLSVVSLLSHPAGVVIKLIMHKPGS